MVEISIIIPIYNKEKYLNTLLKQISMQSYVDFECLLIDDGSTDSSGEICDAFVKTDNRFFVIHLINGGVSNARNVGLRKSTGKYITFIDADDTISYNYIENLHNCMLQNDVDLVISGVVKVWENCKKQQKVFPPITGRYMLTNILNNFVAIQMATGIFGICVAKLFRKELTNDIGFDSELCLSEDFDFYLKLYLKVNTIFLDDKAYYFYLQEAENSSVKIADDQIDYLAQAKIQLRLKNYLIQVGEYSGENKKLVDRNISRYFYFVLHYSNKNEFITNFETLYKYYKINKLELLGENIQQKLLLYLLKLNKKNTAKFLVNMYYCMRRFIKKG